MRAGIFGRGRLGSTVAALLQGDASLELAWAVDKGENPSGPVDVALESSVPAEVEGRLDWALATRTNLVIGTTGWDPSILERFRQRRGHETIGVLVAPNFSIGAAFLCRVAMAAGRLASLSGGGSLGVSERHHAAKKDAPSGTAKAVANAAAAGAGLSGWVLGAWEEGKVSVSSLRCGSEIGWHELRLELPGEILTAAHEAKSRDVFAHGAIRSLRWMHGRKGIFTFGDMADELLGEAFSLGEREERNTR